MSRFNRTLFAGLWSAQESRKNMREGDPLFASKGGERFSRGTPENRATTARVEALKHEPLHVLERDVLAAVLQAVAIHPKVAWAHRMNTGAVERENADGTKRYIAFAFKGCSDIIGQMKDGRFLAIECKRPGGKVTADQIAFLTNVRRSNGVAFIAWSVDDVIRELAGA